MSLNHQFLFVSNDRYSDNLYQEMVWDKNGFNSEKSNIQHYTEIYDDTLRYFDDFLKWIPTYNPSQKIEKMGFNYWGPTVVKRNHLEKFENIIESIIGLFKNAPDSFELTGDFTEHDNKSYYKKMFLKKAELLIILNDILELIKLAISENGCIYILGI